MSKIQELIADLEYMSDEELDAFGPKLRELMDAYAELRPDDIAVDGGPIVRH